MTHSGRDATGKFTQSLEGAERDAEAVRLRTRGMSYTKISEQLGYGGHQNAARAVKKTLADVTREAAEEHVTIQLQRLDMMYEAELKVLEAHHYTVSQGRLIHLHEDAPPLEDDSPVLSAVDRLLKIEERRSRLLGLDAPTKTTVTHATSDVDAAVAELAAALDAREGQQA
jgi:hypothetical protein